LTGRVGPAAGGEDGAGEVGMVAGVDDRVDDLADDWVVVTLAALATAAEATRAWAICCAATAVASCPVRLDCCPASAAVAAVAWSRSVAWRV